MKHPYPEHVVEAVAKAMWRRTAMGTIHPNYKWENLAPEGREHGIESANAVLEAMWDASRVDTLDQLAQLPGDEVILGQDYWLGYTPDAQFQLGNDDLPAHVLHWGDTDE